ncbi:patatin-like phospholipase family protein [Kangiella sp. HZ709]|uniref:patatin-like phospholipase family protein n=1 Tax=Kangiella sp. HZ709 TaxID=2666328 RepID=UPI0012B15B66|nr:patatin-like phospholipase family protein [Kangiella sp. HZ709]MRX28308.1 patatin-like phospholipase family protein [Kangiella sp. HZ709]
MTDSQALVLSGGGARAAYQIGVLNAVNEILSQPKESPFSIITGVSAGAINGTVLATHNHQFSHGLARLSKIWQNFQPNQVYKTGAGHLSKNFFHWLWALAKPKNQNQKAISLLDNSPLESLLASMVQFESIDSNIQLGNLTALCTTSYDYNNGDSVSFHQSTNNKSWKRYRRRGQAATISLDHLMASAAIPVIFPSRKIGATHYGDGALRFLAPLSPALHLNANKLFVITVNPLKAEEQKHTEIPSIGDISGHLLNSIFVDSLESDIERLRRVNELLSHIPDDDIIKSQLALRPIDALIISPSIDPAELAGQYFEALPKSLKFFFKRIGIAADKGENILSYLLFYAPFTQHLMQIGFQDAMQEKEAITAFFSEQK